MKPTTDAIFNYFLDAPLEVLHKETLEWMEEVEFWKHEVAFFYKLLRERGRANPSSLETEDAKSIEKHLVHVSAERLDQLKSEAVSHEGFLAKIMDNAQLDKQLYRSRHEVLTKEFTDFENEYKELKKKIFQLAEGIRPELKK